MKRFFLMAALLGVALQTAHGSEPIVARTDFDVPEHWQPKIIMGQSCRPVFNVAFTDGAFWRDIMLPGVLRNMPENYQRLANLPAFRDAIGSYVHGYSEDLGKFIKGGETVHPKKLVCRYSNQALSAASQKNRPFIIRNYAMRPLATRLRPSFNHDRQGYEQWLKAHPGFLYFDIGEWDNDSRNAESFAKSELSKGKLTQTEYQDILQRFAKAETRDDLVRRAKTVFDMSSALFFNDPGRLSFMNAGWNTGHLAAFFGAGMITMETSNTAAPGYYYRWQVSLAFTRGAARQYSIPWSWYIASYYNGYTPEGKWCTDFERAYPYDNHPKAGPENGISESLLNRNFYLAYLTGANFIEKENWMTNMLMFKFPTQAADCKLSPYGEAFIKFWDFCRANPDRGTSYAPVALLVPFNQGYPTFGGRAWSKCREYTGGDYMIDAFMATIIPGFDGDAALRQGKEGALFASPYGDIFDVVIPDAPKSTNLATVLAPYKVAVLLGDYRTNPSMARQLQEYVRNGGTLVLNAAQLSSDFTSDFPGFKLQPERVKLPDDPRYRIQKIDAGQAEVILNSKKGSLPLALLNRYGQGRVLTFTAEYLTPEVKPESAFRAISGQDRFFLVDWLLKRLSKETLPLKVSGRIQYGLNKCDGSWLLYLINNDGVTKFANKPQVIDASKAASVKIEFPRERFSSITELLSGQELFPGADGLTLTVPAGGLQILKLNLK